MADEMIQTPQKPKKLWDGALKMVKGENTTQLIEQFTAEMTLVAEGLCEDQSKLRRETDRMITEEDQRIQKLESTIEMLENTIDEERNQRDRELTETRNRLAALERKMEKAEKTEQSEKGKREKRNIIRDLTVLVAIAAGAWVIVTVLNTLVK
jgi:predicted RNase H-like nuclease (RuvC/YqgF family)